MKPKLIGIQNGITAQEFRDNVYLGGALSCLGLCCILLVDNKGGAK